MARISPKICRKKWKYTTVKKKKKKENLFYDNLKLYVAV